MFSKSVGTIWIAAIVTGAVYPQLSPAAPQAPEQTDSQQTDAQQSPADKALADRVSAALNADTKEYYRHVTVIAKQGVVTLGGFVWSPEAQSKAKQLAAGVHGVTKVVDQIQLEQRGYGGNANQ